MAIRTQTPSNEAQALRAIVARQPICDRRQRTYAYELLFRDPETEQCIIKNGDNATAKVVFNFIVDIGLDRVVGSSQAFINLTREFLMGTNCDLLPKDRVILEILEDSIPDPEFLKEIGALKARGYRFALDDYNFQEQLLPFIPLCGLIKVDLRLVDRDRLIYEMPDLRARSIKLLAEKVETQEEFDFCMELGFDYFQGYFFCKPKIVEAATMPTNRVNVCRLLARLQQPDVTSQEVEAILSEDPAMSYRLLRYINSASFALSKKIESINHAVRMVGLDHIRALSSLVLLSSMDDKPQELIKTSIIRARACQMLAKNASLDQGAYFTAGLFSTLDAFLNCSMENALSLLPIADDIRNALLHSTGPVGRALTGVIAFEQMDWDRLGDTSIERDKVAEAYLDSVGWGSDLL